jgi:hypothetical protein
MHSSQGMVANFQPYDVQKNKIEKEIDGQKGSLLR